jgi:hypothetical protein
MDQQDVKPNLLFKNPTIASHRLWKKAFQTKKEIKSILKMAVGSMDLEERDHRNYQFC